MDTCKCRNFVDGDGYGECRKRDPRVGRLLSCYVDASSECKDVVLITGNASLAISANACEDENEGVHQLFRNLYRLGNVK